MPPLGELGPAAAPGTQRRESFFSRRASVFPEKSDKRPVAIQMFNFYRALKAVCSLKPSTECHFPCSDVADLSLEDEELASLEWLQSLAHEGNTEELQFQLFMREIQRLNPKIGGGCLFIDGLYEFVCSRMPVGSRIETSFKGSSARDLLTMHKSGNLLLQKYWYQPDDPQEHAGYLAVASSFVQYVHSTYGPEGVSQFLKKLDCEMGDPQENNFRFKGKDILALEFKWKKFAEAQVHEKFRLSTPKMVLVLFRRYLLAYWFRLLVVFLIILADIGSQLLITIGLGRVISFGFASSTLKLIIQWSGILLGAVLLRSLTRIISIAILASVAVHVSNRLRKKLSARLHEVNPNFLKDHSPGCILSTFSQDVGSIETVVAYGLRTVVWGVLTVLTLIVFALVTAWPLGIALTAVFLSGQILVSAISARLSNHSFAKSQATSKLCDILKEEIDGFAVNRLYGLGDFWQFQMTDAIHSYFSRKARRSLFLSKFILLFQETVPHVTTILLIFGIILLARYDITSFEKGLRIFIFFSSTVIAYTQTSAALPQLQAAAIALGRINAMLKNRVHNCARREAPNTTPGKEGSLPEDVQQDLPASLPVEFKSVSFSYEAAASHWILYNVSLKIGAGERVAVVGKNGAGKSTFLGMVLQRFKPVHGEVIIGNESEKSNYKGLKVAATFQHNHVFNMSICENIRMGNLQASDEQVEEAAKLADIHNWIMSLPRGYDTVLKAGGSSLSGGQKQRVSIARMLVANAPVMILDEVTSALDPPTETRVFEKLMEVTKGRTVISVTHRLAQASHFDRIIVLSHGRLKEMGTHDELLAAQGTYWQMWNNDTSDTPDKAVPILRRRSVVSLQCNVVPELSIVPLSTRCGTPAQRTDCIQLVTPMFTPMLTLNETGETSKHSSIAKSSRSTVVHVTTEHTSLDVVEDPILELPTTPLLHQPRSATPLSKVSGGTVTEAPLPMTYSTPLRETEHPLEPIVVVQPGADGESEIEVHCYRV